MVISHSIITEILQEKDIIQFAHKYYPGEIFDEITWG
jgi:hypothetical protein